MVPQEPLGRRLTLVSSNLEHVIAMALLALLLSLKRLLLSVLTRFLHHIDAVALVTLLLALKVELNHRQFLLFGAQALDILEDFLLL